MQGEFLCFIIYAEIATRKKIHSTKKKKGEKEKGKKKHLNVWQYIGMIDSVLI